MEKYLVDEKGISLECEIWLADRNILPEQANMLMKEHVLLGYAVKKNKKLYKKSWENLNI